MVVEVGKGEKFERGQPKRIVKEEDTRILR